MKEEKVDLKLIKLSTEQENRKDLKFVYDLPETNKQAKKLLEKLSEEDKLIVLQRIRDYYNPIL